jgi:hypothetical protein
MWSKRQAASRIHRAEGVSWKPLWNAGSCQQVHTVLQPGRSTTGNINTSVRTSDVIRYLNQVSCRPRMCLCGLAQQVITQRPDTLPTAGVTLAYCPYAPWLPSADLRREVW